MTWRIEREGCEGANEMGNSAACDEPFVTEVNTIASYRCLSAVTHSLLLTRLRRTLTILQPFQATVRSTSRTCGRLICWSITF